MEQSYKEKYEQAIEKLRNFYRDYDMVSCLIDVKEELANLFPELTESEDEKVRKKIINYFQCQSEEEPTRKEVHNKWIAWLENIPVTNDHEKREGFHLGYKACLERQAEQKPEENKGNIGGISPSWSEEDEVGLGDTLWAIKQARTIAKDENDMGNLWYAERWLKSLKDRVQPKQEWSEEDEDYLLLLNSICKDAEEKYRNSSDVLVRKEIANARNWLKSLRPQNRWKPSEGDIIILEKLIKGELEPKVFQATLQGILEQLKKL